MVEENKLNKKDIIKKWDTVFENLLPNKRKLNNNSTMKSKKKNINNNINFDNASATNINKSITKDVNIEHKIEIKKIIDNYDEKISPNTKNFKLDINYIIIIILFIIGSYFYS